MSDRLMRILTIIAIMPFVIGVLVISISLRNLRVALIFGGVSFAMGLTFLYSATAVA